MWPSKPRYQRLLLFVVIIAGMLCIRLLTAVYAQQATEPKVKTAEPDYAKDPYWQHAKQEVYKGVLEVMAQHQTELQRGWRLNTFIRGDVRKKLVALTFDDGPHAKFTPRLLAILQQEHVPATFFVVGEMAEKHPELVKAEVAAGHAIGNHTYHHVNLTKILEPDVATEIKACGETLQRITGKTPHLFRPPGGDYDKGVAETATALGYTTVLWTDDPGDYASPGDPVIFKRTLAQVSKGGIILLHDGIEQTIDILPKLITTLKQRGYQFVTVDELMRGRKAGSSADLHSVQ